MRFYYPKNLKSEAKLWVWSLRDLAVIGAAFPVSAFVLVRYGGYLPMALTLAFTVLTVRSEDRTVLDFISAAVRFFLLSRQVFFWRDESAGGMDPTKQTDKRRKSER